MNIRLAELVDWKGLQSLLRAMVYAEHTAPEDLHARFARLVAADHHVLVIAGDGDELAGYAWAQDFGPHLRSGEHTARLHDLYVAPPYRRRGVGRGLFLVVREWARERGVRWLQWQAGSDATAFYERLGLSPTPTDEVQHPFCEIDFRKDN